MIRNHKHLLAFFLLVCLLVCTEATSVMAAPDWPDQVTIEAESGIVIDANSGTILFGKNMHEHYFPASITKILTALIVIENCDLDETVTFSQNAVYNVEAGSSNMAMDTGDQLSVRDCLYGLLLKSANEVANALAEHVAGSIDEFSVMMNEKATSLGCQDSNFANPSGLNNENHYVSAYDMALIAKAAFANDTFVQIDSSTYYDIPPTIRNPEGLRIYPGHKMLKKNEAEYYSGIIGGKTGYTSLAGNTLVTCAEKNGMKLISVILNGHMTHYSDTRTLLDFGFSNFKSVSPSGTDSPYASVINDMTIAGLTGEAPPVLYLDSYGSITLPVSAQISDADTALSYELQPGDPPNAVARIDYTYHDRKIGNSFLLYDAQAVAQINNAVSSSPADPENNISSQQSSASSTKEPETTPNTVAPIPEEPATTLSHTSDTQPVSGNYTIPLIVAGIFLLVIAGLVIWWFHRRKQDEVDLLLRRERRRQRLEESGVSPSEFDLMMEKHRSTYTTKRSFFSWLKREKH